MPPPPFCSLCGVDGWVGVVHACVRAVTCACTWWRSDVSVRPLSRIFLHFAHVYSFAWVGGRHSPWPLCVEVRGQLGGVTSLLHHVGSKDETKFSSKHHLSAPAPYFVRQSLLALTAFSRLDNQQHSPAPCLSPNTSYRCTPPCLTFTCTGIGDPNGSPHTCIASTLPRAISQPCDFFLLFPV